MKKTILAILAAAAAAASAVSVFPAGDMRIKDTVISWDFIGTPSEADAHHISRRRRYVMVDHYTDGLISDAVMVTMDYNAYSGPTDAYAWHVLTIEAYKDTDAAWLSLELGF